MKAAAFNYQRAHTLADAMDALSLHGVDAKPLAGGQSIGPMLNLRLVRPRLLIDVSGLAEMRETAVQPDGYWIGGALTHAEIEDSRLDALLRDSPSLAQMLRHVAGGIAYRAVRNRGTLAGSLAHADPAADWVLAMMTLDAQLRVESSQDKRWVAMTQFMSGAFTTVLRDGELLSGLRIPRYSAAMRWGYYKFCRKTGEFAQASCAAVFDPDRGIARIVIGALDGAPAALPQLAAAVAQQGAVALADDAVSHAVARAASGKNAVERQLLAAAVKRCVRQVVGV
jgi:carbon-monoxide dehydrogenase medium subunit